YWEKTVNFKVITDHPVAVNSVDHLHPMGAIRDNHSNPMFNDKITRLIPKRLVIMDLGCSGGGFVKSLIDSRNDAIGLEGSDRPFLDKRAEWKTIPDNLFT